MNENLEKEFLIKMSFERFWKSLLIWTKSQWFTVYMQFDIFGNHADNIASTYDAKNLVYYISLIAHNLFGSDIFGLNRYR